MPDDAAVRLLWKQFHNVWGQARGGIYTEEQWHTLQRLLEELVGLGLGEQKDEIDWRD